MEALGGVLGRVLGRLGLERGVRGWRAVQEWSGVVGPKLASRTHAVSFRDGVLDVEVEGSAWMHELGFLKRDLLRRIHERLGSDEVRDVRFRLARGGNQR